MVRSVLPLVWCALAACSGGASDDTGGAAEDTDIGPNPIVPDEYALLWDIDAASCDSEDAIVYFLFNGTIDGEGNLDGKEGWYWFFKDDGWEGDCVDTFDVTGAEGELGWSTSPCSGCDREFLADWSLEDADGENACPGYGYESFFDDDDKDRIDEEKYTGDIMLDTLSPSGNVNDHMLVFAYTQDDQSETTYIPRPDSRGEYVPDEGADYATGSASLSWVISQGMCVSFSR
jgi:hypothetical protein